MKISFNHFPVLADLFRYPEEDYKMRIDLCKQLLQKKYPEANNLLDPFFNYVNSGDVRTMEEIYTQTFHIQAICYLDLGYVVFGEDYKRGEFLVNMKREQLEAGNDCGNDLPDNLVNMLTLLPKMQDYNLAVELSRRIIIPGINKMIGEFDKSKIDQKISFLKKKHRAIIMEGHFEGNIYRYPLEALAKVFENDFRPASIYPDLTVYKIHNSFLSGCLPQALGKRNQFQY